MAVVIVLALCVVIICVLFGIGVADVQGAFGRVNALFPEGFFQAYWNEVTAGLGFHLMTLVIGIVIGIATAVFGGRR